MYTKTFLELSKTLLELGAMGGDRTAGLTVLLERLLHVLQNLPATRFLPQATLLLYNKRGKSVAVAQYGFRNADLVMSPAFNRLASELPHEPLPGELKTIPEFGSMVLFPLVVESQRLGVIAVCCTTGWKPTAAKKEFFGNLATGLSGLVHRCITDTLLKVRELELKEARTQALQRLGTASEFRDNETGMHIMRMTNISVAIAKSLGLPPDQRELLSITAPMHDVGKIGIPDIILLKPEKLTLEEFTVMQNHTSIGGQLLQGTEMLIETARAIAESHHENWDGTGYPQGLRGEEIPLLARICAVADVFDALTSERPYKKAWDVEKAICWVMEQAGKKFDPEVTRAFQEALPEILKIRELYRDDIINPRQIIKLPELPAAPTAWVHWTEDLRVGIDAIDAHHQYLFDLVNDLIEEVINGTSLDEILHILNALSAYVYVHFRAEERMMEHYRFDNLEYHKQQHKAFELKLKELSREMHENPMVAQFEIINFLTEWLVTHITHEDTKLAALLYTRVES